MTQPLELAILVAMMRASPEVLNEVKLMAQTDKNLLPAIAMAETRETITIDLK